MKFSSMGLDLFKSKKESSYNCSSETDILVDVDNNVIVRVLGVRLQAYDIKNNSYSKGK